MAFKPLFDYFSAQNKTLTSLFPPSQRTCWQAVCIACAPTK